MLTQAFFTERPEKLLCRHLPTGETDVWLRKNITKVTDPKTEETGYAADEAYMRTASTAADIEAEFEKYYEIAAAWQPTAKSKREKELLESYFAESLAEILLDYDCRLTLLENLGE